MKITQIATDAITTLLTRANGGTEATRIDMHIVDRLIVGIPFPGDGDGRDKMLVAIDEDGPGGGRVMAKRKPVSTGTAIVVVPPKPVVINAGKRYDPRNPHSWLRLLGDPSGTVGTRIMHGTLRLRLGDHPQANSAEAFFRAKCRPVDSVDPLAVTACRYEVLVPSGVDDSFADPWMLPRHIDHSLARETNGSAPICCYWTVSDPQVRHLHEQWRTGRRVVEQLVDRFRVPMLLVQHVPEQASSANPPHLHCLAAVRVLSSRGFGAPVTALVGDKARQVFVEAWAKEAG